MFLKKEIHQNQYDETIALLEELAAEL